MKNKILLSTLLGGALLAACTADDALDVKEVAGGVNPAAPVFNVSFDSEEDNDVTRAIMGEGNTGISWEHGDLMSLYHGGGEISNGSLGKISSTDNFFSSDIFAYTRNAIYVSAEGTGGAKSTFTTQAMVLPGAAVMIYPADVDMLHRTSNTPIISVPEKQIGGEAGERTRDKAPHVSEVLNITDHTDLNEKNADGTLKNPHSAGYGRTYDIVMRRISAMLSLSLSPENNGDIEKMVEAGEINDIEFSKVAIDVTASNGAEPFTTEATVQIGRERGVNQTDLGKTIGDNIYNSSTGTYEHGYWKFSPYIEPTTDGKKSHIETTDLGTNKKTAYFTLLPYDDRDDVVLNTTNMETITENGKVKNEFAGGKYAKPEFSDAKIKVNTNYGYVICKDETTEKWSRSNGMTYNLTNGLAEFLYSAFYPQDEQRTKDAGKNANGDDVISFNKVYQNQVIARGGSRTLKVNMKDLVMNGLHVKDQKNLLDALKVYDALVKNNNNNKNVTLILDGEEKGTYKGKFVLDKTGWEKVSEYRNSNVKFALCASENNPDEVCTAIVLKNTAANAEEVPQLAFAVTQENGIEDPVQSDVTVELVGNWKYEQGEIKENNVDRYKQLTGVTTLKVVKDAVLDLKNNVLAQDDHQTNKKNLWIQIETGGTMNVKYYNTRVGVNVKNNGVVNIKKAADETGKVQLWMNNGKTFVNEIGTAVVAKDLHVLKTEEELKAVGTGIVHNDEGWFGIESGSNAKIENYGHIFLSANAQVYVSVNASVKGSKTAAWQNAFDETGNKIGSIVLADKNAASGNVVVNDKTKQGFIKLYLNANNVETAGTVTADDCGTVANYIVLEEGFKSYESGSKTLEYIEVSESNQDQVFMGNADLNGLIVNPGCSVNIPQNVTVYVRQRVYLKGTISLGGTYKSTETTSNETVNYVGYFGGDESDRKNVMVY